MTVAAAITTFNRLEMLKRCIEAVRAQSVPPDEIIVVDDASSDGTATWLREQDDLVAIIQPGNGCIIVRQIRIGSVDGGSERHYDASQERRSGLGRSDAGAR